MQIQDLHFFLYCLCILVFLYICIICLHWLHYTYRDIGCTQQMCMIKYSKHMTCQLHSSLCWLAPYHQYPVLTSGRVLTDFVGADVDASGISCGCRRQSYTRWRRRCRLSSRQAAVWDCHLTNWRTSWNWRLSRYLGP